ncbi:MAG: zinc-binding dehydrogenase [Opitutaceae bacterium]|nr:zinc-binding dehydrogenase [Opitutaceae bacterium]
MKSLLFQGQSAIEVVEVPVPLPGPGQVAIDTVASALCGSELHGYAGPGFPSGNFGHEGAGVVSALGAGVTGLRVGDRVGVSAIAGCGHCRYCERRQYTWCADRQFHGSMHAQTFVTAANACHLLPDDVPWEVGVLISGDALGVPYHTSTMLARYPVDTVAVFGLGPIGLGQVIMQTYLGKRVIGIDLSPERRALAEGYGAWRTLDAKAVDAVEAVRSLTGGGADACVEAAGRAVTAKQCFAAVRTGGVVVFNGEHQHNVELSISEDFIRRDITAFGAWFYHFGEFDAMLALYRQGLPIARLVTHRLPLTSGAEAFRLFASGRTGKVLLTGSG